jgi:transposase
MKRTEIEEIREWVAKRSELGTMKQLANRIGVPLSTISSMLHRERTRGAPWIIAPRKPKA